MLDIDTIAAISTPLGEGAIGIVRLSGPDAFNIIDKVFKSPSGKKLSEVNSHTIHYGHIVDPKTKETIEEVMVSVMKRSEERRVGKEWRTRWGVDEQRETRGVQMSDAY